MTRVLIGSPIHQKAEILNEFFISFSRLYKTNLTVDYCFFDDNNDNDTRNLIGKFKSENNEVIIFQSNDHQVYIKNQVTHYWNDQLIWKVATMKNKIIQYAIEKQYDYLFLVDSDLVLHPQTLKKLISTEKDIICNIFWTAWQPEALEMPQVWMEDEYSMCRKQNPPLSEEEIRKQTLLFIHQLKIPGVYEVGGLGACTLISKKALDAGVNFSKISNLSFWGEDRHFCIRAAALGFKLFVDTHFPAYHIYRESDLKGVEGFKSNF
jgi:GT2 family glycosyltransferase